MASPRWRPSAGTYLLLLLILVSTVPLLVFAYVEADRKQLASLERYDLQMQTQASTVAGGLRRVLQAKEDVLATQASTFASMEQWGAAAREVLRAQQAATHSFDGIYLAGVDAVSVGFAPEFRLDGSPSRAGVSYADRDYVRELLRTGGPAYSQVQRGRQSGQPGIKIGVPVFAADNPDQLRGIVGAGIRLQILEQVARDVHGGAGRSRVLVVDGHGHSLIDTAGGLAPLDELDPSTLFAMACPEEGGVGVDGMDELAIPVRAGCTQLAVGSQRWSVWSSTPRAVLSSVTGDARTETLNLALVALLAALLASWALARQIGHGIRKLTATARRVGAGDFAFRPSPPHRLSTRESAEVREVVAGTMERLSTMDVQNRALVFELKEANAQLEPLATAWREMGEAVEILEPDGTVRFVNPAYERMLGAKEDVVGQPSRLLTRDLPGTAEAKPSEGGLAAALEQGQSWSGELQTQTPVGPRVLATTVSPVLAADGSVRLLVVLRHDVTERHRAQAAAAHQERLASLGATVAGLAHEINNPLTCVHGNLQLIEEDARSLPVEAAGITLAAAEALDGVERVAGLVRSLLRLARGGPASAPVQQAEAVALQELVDAALTLCAPQLPRDLDVSVQVPAVMASGVEAELVQVVMNLVLNAVHAMAERPVRNLRFKGFEDGDTVVLEVTDSGAGMEPALLQRAFEPFFTTKAPGQGTGLGLPLCRSIVEAHGGQLTVRSELGAGSTFSLRLPRHELGAKPLSLQSGEAGSQVLLVDDDVPVARALARALRGLEVTICHSAEEALARLADGLQAAVVVSDVRMPGATGLDLLDALRRLHPHLSRRLLFVTGGTPDPAMALRLRDSGRPVLGKPVDGDELRRQVHELLAWQTPPASAPRSLAPDPKVPAPALSGPRSASR